MGRRFTLHAPARVLALMIVAVGLLALPAAGAQLAGDEAPAGLLGRLSQAVQLHYYANHPAAAPAPLQASLAGLKKLQKGHTLGAKHSLACGPVVDGVDLLLGALLDVNSVGRCRGAQEVPPKTR